MITCPNCGVQLKDDAVFCGNCGIKFVRTPAPSSKDAFIAQVNELCRIANELSVSYVDEMTAMENAIGASGHACNDSEDIRKELEEEKENSAKLSAALKETLAELEAVKAEKNAVFAEVASLRAELDVMRLYAPEPTAVQKPFDAPVPELVHESKIESVPSVKPESDDASVIDVKPEQEPAEVPVPDPVPVPSFCPECGSPATPEMSFCRECGTKLK